MNEIGQYSLSLAWGFALLGVFAGFYSGYKENYNILALSKRLTISVFICTLISILTLGYLFLTNDYSNQFVWQHSNSSMPPIYKIAAIWGGMDGSMLLWGFILSFCNFLVALRVYSYPKELSPWVLAVLNFSMLFFLTVLLFMTNPFRYVLAEFVPPDGNGLNPLLQNPYMAAHPPMLYLGFTTFTVPYAFCLAALFSNKLDNVWIILTKNWSLLAWGFLTIGIVLGGHWAYIELGWGGFWAWDPVENSSFLPWLTATAFIHSVMVQERKNILKVWNIWLVVLTYSLTIFGTFLTRSGIVQSVHAFASTNVGWVFLVYLSIILIVTLILTITRYKNLKSKNRIQSLLSREAAFLFNNLILLSIAFATLWGVLFPVFSEYFTGIKQAVGIPFFNTINVPLFLALIFLMAMGPLIAWKKANLKNLKKTFIKPFLVSLTVGIILLWSGINRFYPTLSYCLCSFVFFTLMTELHRGVSTQKGSNSIEKTTKLLRKHKSRYAGYLVHAGVTVMVIAITASMAHKIEREFSIGIGDEYQVGRFKLSLNSITTNDTKNYSALIAETQVNAIKDNSKVALLKPELRHYFRNKESTTEVALKMGLKEDIYLVLAGLDDSGKRASFKIFINPLQIWLWIGAIIVVFGTLIVLLSRTIFRKIRV